MSGERDACCRARNRRSESGDGLLGVSRRPTTSLLRDSPSLLARLLRLSFSFALFTPPYVILGFSRFSRPCSGVYGVCRDQGSGGAHGWGFVGLLAIKGASVQSVLNGERFFVQIARSARPRSRSHRQACSFRRGDSPEGYICPRAFGNDVAGSGIASVITH